MPDYFTRILDDFIRLPEGEQLRPEITEQTEGPTEPAVFNRGEGVTAEPIIYFYNPNLCESEFHESQIFVIEIQNHRFFKEGPSL